MSSRQKVVTLHSIEGVVVKVVDYQEYDNILHVFTREHGMQTFIAKRAKCSKSKKIFSPSPLMHAEFLVDNLEKSLPVCREISVISHYISLRKDFDRLNNACRMLKALKEALPLGKEAFLLFDLLLVYLNALVSSKNSLSFVASFLLKTMRHEGLFTLPVSCSSCECVTDGFNFTENNFYCRSHSPSYSLFISSEQQNICQTLMYSRQIPLIEEAVVDTLLMRNIDSLFAGIISS